MCKADPSRYVANLTSFGTVLARNEQALIDAIRTIGPISVAIYVSNDFFNYADGVYFDKSYNGQSVNHAVTAIGYGNLNGLDFYLVRNSYGTNWALEVTFSLREMQTVIFALLITHSIQ